MKRIYKSYSNCSTNSWKILVLKLVVRSGEQDMHWYTVYLLHMWEGKQCLLKVILDYNFTTKLHVEIVEVSREIKAFDLPQAEK